MEIHFQYKPNTKNNLKIGTSGGGTKYTIERGQPVFIGTDGDSNTNRVIPVTDISSHAADGLALSDTADTAYADDCMAVAFWPVRVFTDNVDGSNPPVATADNFVYILDAGTFSNADGGSAGHSYGKCAEVIASGKYSGLYDLNLTSIDET